MWNPQFWHSAVPSDDGPKMGLQNHSWRTGSLLTATIPAPGVPYFTPAQSPPAGTAFDLLSPDEAKRAAIPTLFRPLTIRGMTLANRIAVSPMSMYSADEGHATDFHLVHLGQLAMRGAALTMLESTCVTRNGRISPEDLGIWQDSQIAPLKRITDFIHSQGHKVGVQLQHSGRKGSTLALWNGKKDGSMVAEVSEGGWPDDVWAPSAVPYSSAYPMPKALSVEGIKGIVRQFGEAARRALKAGFDVIEINGAHGYLVSQFLSPNVNKRTDEYGGSFENRIRFLTETIREVRSIIPEDMPLIVRVSGTEWMEWAGQPSWDVPSTIALAKLLPDVGVDLIDVSTGGIVHEQKIHVTPTYQVNIAGQEREALHKEGKQMLIGAVGMITSAEMAKSIVQDGEPVHGGTETRPEGEKGVPDGTIEVEGEIANGHKTTTQADMVSLGRQFLREPEFVMNTAIKLGVKLALPVQYSKVI